MASVATMIVAGDNAAPRRCGVRKVGIAIRVFAQAMHDLNNMGAGAAWEPKLQMYYAAI